MRIPSAVRTAHGAQGIIRPPQNGLVDFDSVSLHPQGLTGANGQGMQQFSPWGLPPCPKRRRAEHLDRWMMRNALLPRSGGGFSHTKRVERGSCC